MWHVLIKLKSEEEIQVYSNVNPFELGNKDKDSFGVIGSDGTIYFFMKEEIIYVRTKEMNNG